MSDVLLSQPTDAAVTTSPNDNSANLIALLISAHGDIDLAAERAHITPSALLAQLPSISQDELNAALRTALTVHLFSAFIETKTIVTGTLSELSPSTIAKLMLDLAAQLSGIVAPPPPVQNPLSTATVNIMNNMNSEAEQAREQLARRLAATDPAVINQVASD